MKTFLLTLALACAGLFSRAESYLGAGGALVLPQGDSSLRRVGGAAVRGGTYLSDTVALEGEIAWLEDSAGLGARALCHAAAWEWYDRLFGFSAFDPFCTAGVAGLLGRRKGQVGPEAGLGFFYHLGDNWSLRTEASALLGLETRVEMDWRLSAGVQYAF